MRRYEIFSTASKVRFFPTSTDANLADIHRSATGIGQVPTEFAALQQRDAGRRLTSGIYNYVLFRGLKLQPQDLVIGWTQFFSSISVVGQNVEMAVRSNGDVTQASVDSILQVASKPAFDIRYLIVFVIVFKLDTNQCFTTQRGNEEVPAVKGHSCGRHGRTTPHYDRIPVFSDARRADDLGPAVVGSFLDDVDLVALIDAWQVTIWSVF